MDVKQDFVSTTQSLRPAYYQNQKNLIILVRFTLYTDQVQWLKLQDWLIGNLPDEKID